MQKADCLKEIKPYFFVEINKKKAQLIEQGYDVISLGVGDPDMPTPPFIVDAMIEAIKDPANHHYPAYAGSTEYKKACADWMKRRFDVTLNPDTQMLMLIGSKEGLGHLHTAFVNPGEYVLAPSICYPVYSVGATLNNGKTYYLPMSEENNWLADFDHIPEEILSKAKIMFLGYPNNPTGAIATEEYFDKAIDFCISHNIVLAHDNAYSEITYDGYKAPSILQRPRANECCIEFFSLSKMYNMTGWRIGFCCGNPEIVGALSTVKNNLDTGQSNAIQQTAIVALNSGDEFTSSMCALYQKRRDYLVFALNEMGLKATKPLGSLYVWAKVPDGYTSASFADKVLSEAHVVVTPGSAYGSDGEGYIRISLSTPDQRLEEAVRRMRELLY